MLYLSRYKEPNKYDLDNLFETLEILKVPT